MPFVSITRPGFSGGDTCRGPSSSPFALRSEPRARLEVSRFRSSAMPIGPSGPARLVCRAGLVARMSAGSHSYVAGMAPCLGIDQVPEPRSSLNDRRVCAHPSPAGKRASTKLQQRRRSPISLPLIREIAYAGSACRHAGEPAGASAVTRRRSILACLCVLAALAGPPAWAQTWPSLADLRDFALAEAHEAKLDARVRRHHPSHDNSFSTAAIEDALAATQFRSMARAAKIGHARKIRIALRVWKPELYAAWRACKGGRGPPATCPGIELQYAHARTAVSYVLAQREAAAWAPEAGPSPEPAEGSAPPVPTPGEP
jgi:hypothetical protein